MDSGFPISDLRLLNQTVAMTVASQKTLRRSITAKKAKRIDQWEIPSSTALHWAAMRNHEELAKLLLANGADPNLLAGNGCTALDLAEQRGAHAVAALIEQHGGKRSTKSPHGGER